MLFSSTSHDQHHFMRCFQSGILVLSGNKALFIKYFAGCAIASLLFLLYSTDSEFVHQSRRL